MIAGTWCMTKSSPFHKDKNIQYVFSRSRFNMTECWNIQSTTVQSSENFVFLFPSISVSLPYAPTILPRNNSLTLNILKQSSMGNLWSFGSLSCAVNTRSLLNQLLPVIWCASNPSDQTQNTTSHIFGYFRIVCYHFLHINMSILVSVTAIFISIWIHTPSVLPIIPIPVVFISFSEEVAVITKGKTLISIYLRIGHMRVLQQYDGAMSLSGLGSRRFMMVDSALSQYFSLASLCIITRDT